MNAGKHHTKARAQAQANADRSQSPRWLHQYGGSWWISTTPVADAERINPGAAKSHRHATKKKAAGRSKKIKISTSRPIGWTITDPARPGWSETGTTTSDELQKAFQSKRHHATKKSPAQLQREIDETLASTRRYHVVVINERTGKKAYMTATPVTHREGSTILRKITDYPWRRKQLEEVA